MDKQSYWLGFSLIPNIGTQRILHLRNHFQTLQAAWEAGEPQLIAAGLSENLAQTVVQHRSTINLEHQITRIKKVDASLLTLGDEDYPPNLREVDDAPAVLYIRGTSTPADSRAICIVRTRKPTVYGRDAAYKLARELAANDITIVSGLAQGIDSAAHQGALDAGGRTIGVLGCGINRVYPNESLELAREMIHHGAVISEFPLGTPPVGRNFPRRNRILSGLALGVLVVEAGLKSGSLITASLAADQGRDVFAIPSNIFNLEGRGTNRLIQEGAKLVTSADDILEELDHSYIQHETQLRTTQVVPANETEQSLLDLLTHDPLHIDEIVRLTGLPTATVSSTLTILELKGLARTTGNMLYSLP